VHGLTMPSSCANIHPLDHECGQRSRRHKLGGELCRLSRNVASNRCVRTGLFIRNSVSLWSELSATSLDL
jgi:hypothetical protein